jgi:hypothetical protein
MAFWQLEGSPLREHLADQPETRNRCDGKLHDVSGWNMWSCRTKFLAYVQ